MRNLGTWLALGVKSVAEVRPDDRTLEDMGITPETGMTVIACRDARAQGHAGDLEAENAALRELLQDLATYASGKSDHDRLKAENDRLRELVRGLWYCTESESRAMCEGCPLGVVEGDRLALACERLMDELGIEEDR